MATARTTGSATAREPRLALNITLKQTAPGTPSVAELASLLGAITRLFVLALDEDGRRSSEPPSLVRLTGGIAAFEAIVEPDGTPLLFTAEEDAALRSWRLDGAPSGPEARHAGHVTALAAVNAREGTLIASGDREGRLRTWLPDGGSGPFERVYAHRFEITGLVSVDGVDGEPMLISAGVDGALRSWRLDENLGPLQRLSAHHGPIRALAIAKVGDDWLVLTAGEEDALRSWWPQGSPGPLTVEDIQARSIASVEHDGDVLVFGGDRVGNLRSWRLSGEPGPLQRKGAHDGSITALAVTQHEGQPLIISTGKDRALRSWWPDGAPGPLQHASAHAGPVVALKVIDRGKRPLLLTAGREGAIRSWRIPRPAWTSFGAEVADTLEIRRLSLASPLDLQVLLPYAMLAPAALGFVLYAIKRVWTFPIELRIHEEKQRARLLAAQYEREHLELTGESNEVIDRARDPVVDRWEVTDAWLDSDWNTK